MSAELKERTKRYALAVLRMTLQLPRTIENDVMRRQLVRCATSVGANYRAACRAKSDADYIAKLKIVEEESDEALYWLELLIDTAAMPQETLMPLIREGDEITAIVVSAIKTRRANIGVETRVKK